MSAIYPCSRMLKLPKAFARQPALCFGRRCITKSTPFLPSGYIARGNSSGLKRTIQTKFLHAKPESHTMSIARVQAPAPDFGGKAVVNGQFADIDLTMFMAQGKWVLLVFVPMAWTFVCPTEIIAYSDSIEEFDRRNTQVIISSTDSEFSLNSWNNASRAEGGLGQVKIPLLSDRNLRISRQYGVLLEDEGIALRGQFLIDPKGVLRQITINDLPVGRSVSEAFRLIDAFQFTEKYGEVCPANWKAGDPSMEPDVHKSRKFFKETYSNH